MAGDDLAGHGCVTGQHRIHAGQGVSVDVVDHPAVGVDRGLHILMAQAPFHLSQGRTAAVEERDVGVA